MMKNEIIVKTDNFLSVKELVEWLESRKAVNETIIIQAIGNIINSHVESVNKINT